MRASGSTKRRAGPVLMEVPKWIKIRELTGFVEDPVNFVAMLTLDEVVEVLLKEGWEPAAHGFSAYIDGERPSRTMQKTLPGAGALMRLHARLWSDGVVVGNVHLDVPTVDAALRLSPHDSIHDLGKAYVAYLFIKHGYRAELLYLGNVTKTNDGFAIKVFKTDVGK